MNEDEKIERWVTKKFPDDPIRKYRGTIYSHFFSVRDAVGRTILYVGPSDHHGTREEAIDRARQLLVRAIARSKKAVERAKNTLDFVTNTAKQEPGEWFEEEKK